VLTTPVEASRVQFARFGAMYPMNARPVQQLNARTVAVGGE
jgi:carbonic anhydrase